MTPLIDVLVGASALPWREDFGPERTGFPSCRFRYTKQRSLYWRNRNFMFHEYDLIAPTPHLDEFISYVANDRSGIVWG